MRSFSVKSSVLALTLVTALATASPALAAARQTRERTRGPVERIVQIIKRMIIGVSPNDEIIIPHPSPETNRP